MALQALQHRGQDAAGVGTYDGERFHLEKNLGLVTQALPERTVQAMKGHVGVGHVRYPTVGGGDKGDAQPFLTRRPGILMAHNGNVTNLKELESSLLEKGIHVLSRCDVEPILMALADAMHPKARVGYGGDFGYSGSYGQEGRVGGAIIGQNARDNASR
jgi:amidophosphoribosyltransferase